MFQQEYILKIRTLDLFIGLLIALAGISMLFVQADTVLLVLGVLLIVGVTYRWPLLGLGVVVLLYPFNQKYLYAPGGLNIPYADVMIIIVAVAWLLKMLIQAIRYKKIQIHKHTWINLILLGLLIGSGLISLLNVWPQQLSQSWHYLWRFIGFNFILYFILTQELVRKARSFWIVSWCMYALGIFLSFMGLASFMWPETQAAFPMATPLSWLGLFPYASSHNLLAESLVSIIPFSWLLIYKLDNKLDKRWLYLGLAFMIAIVVLTFSRTGWIVLALEVFILAGMYYGQQLKRFIYKYWWIGLLGILIFGVYLNTWAQTNFVTSSNSARQTMIEKSYSLWLDKPWIGNGVGTWQPIVSHDVYYVYQYGQPLEQHGVVFKLMAEQGILGVAVWLGLFAYLIYTAIKYYRRFESRNPWKMAVGIAVTVIIGQFVFQLLDTGYYSPKMWLPLGMAMALLYISQRYIGLMHKVEFDSKS